LNQRPLGYEPNELPGCSTPHSYINNALLSGSNRAEEQGAGAGKPSSTRK
jgi:hypothetical protein